ncbi:cell differentiation protein rcd1 [Cryptosporidium ryanae]|uniref:cell differentiation protein rcd1 n=1 Tax=Cryptosporidium ryanae TaxID=515981 RepID=UPI00351A9B17|nr:cell differentiation protein rcd1 [Cryptosporidium ryanae]
MSQEEVGSIISEAPDSSLTEHALQSSSASSSSPSNGNNIQSELNVSGPNDYVSVIGERNGENLDLTEAGATMGIVGSSVGINDARAEIVIGENVNSGTGVVGTINTGQVKGLTQTQIQRQGQVQGSIQGTASISAPIPAQGSVSTVTGPEGAVGNTMMNNDDKMCEVMIQKERVYQYLIDLTNSSKREMALSKLSRYRETFPDLAPLMWHSFGCIAALLQEIISIYPLLSPPSLSNQASNRTCNCLALLQCIASHPETRGHFLSAQIPLYLYPFLNTVTKSRPFEYLRLTSLGVIGALVKVDDPEIVGFLLQTEIIPLCLRVMETGSELSKTVATFIIQKILLDDMGLSYICATPERFFTVCQVLGNVITQHNEAPSPRLLKHIIRCYLRLSENQKVREPLKQIIPPIILTSNFKLIFHDDIVTTKWLHQLYANIC